ncbi:MAG: class I SAM-dependent methyltransferase [Rhodospirillaceae bacterium]
MTQTPSDNSVSSHYTHGGLRAAIAAKIEEAGLPLGGLSVQDLASMDHLHTRGLEATEQMLRSLNPTTNQHLIDIGCGIGGPARWIAREAGCRVTGVDLTEEFIEVAQWLTGLTGTATRTGFLAGDALDLPFDNGAFDGGYTHNVSMSVPDKEKFFAEAFRVIKPGGRFAAAEITLGEGGEVLYPVPWAMTAEISHLTTAEEIRAVLEGAGFRVLDIQASTDQVLAYNARQREKIARDGPPILTPAIVLTLQAKDRLRNSAKNVAEGRTVPVEFLCLRP